MDWVETYTGKKINLLSPDPYSIDIQDIAHGLSQICRFSGQCSHFYSVAQHSINMTIELHKRGCGPRLMLLGMLHDAAEAYIGDITSPLKRLIPTYRKIEKTLQDVVWIGLQITPPAQWEKEIIKRTDELLLGYEAQNLMVCRDSWNRKYIQGKILLSPKNFDYTEPSIIESQFLNAFTSLTSPHIHIKKGGVSS